MDEDGSSICIPYLEKKCTSLVCPQGLSHKSISISSYDMNRLGVYIDEASFTLIVIDLFGCHFQWKYERFISELFRTNCIFKEISKRDDINKKETVRSTRTEPTKVLAYSEYLELMTVCEEAFVGVKPFEHHPAFIVNGIRRGFNSPADPYNLNKLGCVVCNDDPIAQYSNRGLDVPYKISKIKKTRHVKIVGEARQGIGMTDKEVHIDLFKQKAENIAGLMNNLFK